MFPYRDDNETVRTPYATYALIALNVATWLFVQGAGSEYALAASVCNLGLIPGELTTSVRPGTQFPIADTGPVPQPAVTAGPISAAHSATP